MPAAERFVGHLSPSSAFDFFFIASRWQPQRVRTSARVWCGVGRRGGIELSHLVGLGQQSSLRCVPHSVKHIPLTFSSALGGNIYIYIYN